MQIETHPFYSDQTFSFAILVHLQHDYFYYYYFLYPEEMMRWNINKIAVCDSYVYG